MILVYVGIALLCLWGLSVPQKPNTQFENALSQENTTAIKGVFVLFVFLRHFGQYIHAGNALDSGFFAVDHAMGQLIVVPFLFYSGYGIYRSIDQKGQNYVKNLPIKRVLRLLLEFDSAVLVFWLVQTLRGKHYAPLHVVQALLAWKPLANSNWFICVMLVLYLVTWLSFSLFPKRRVWALVCVTVLSVGCMVLFWKTQESRWYNTLLCYAAGLWYARLETPVTRHIRAHYGTCLAGTAGIFAAAALVFCGKLLPVGANNYTVVYPIVALSFALLLVLFTRKVCVNNAVLRWLGGHVFGIYIWQRMPMNVLREIKLQATHRYVYFVLCLTLTLALAELFQRASARIRRNIPKKNQK